MVLIPEFNNLPGLKIARKSTVTIALARFLYSSWHRVPQGTQAILKFSSPIILQNPNYHSMRREKIQGANWFFWWPHERLVLHLTGCWVPLMVFNVTLQPDHPQKCLCPLGNLVTFITQDSCMHPCFHLVGTEALSCSAATTVVLLLTFMSRVQLNNLLLAKRMWLILMWWIMYPGTWSVLGQREFIGHCK